MEYLIEAHTFRLSLVINMRNDVLRVPLCRYVARCLDISLFIHGSKKSVFNVVVTYLAEL